MHGIRTTLERKLGGIRLCVLDSNVVL